MHPLGHHCLRPLAQNLVEKYNCPGETNSDFTLNWKLYLFAPYEEESTIHLWVCQGIRLRLSLQCNIFHHQPSHQDILNSKTIWSSFFSHFLLSLTAWEVAAAFCGFKNWARRPSMLSLFGDTPIPLALTKVAWLGAGAPIAPITDLESNIMLQFPWMFVWLTSQSIGHGKSLQLLVPLRTGQGIPP